MSFFFFSLFSLAFSCLSEDIIFYNSWKKKKEKNSHCICIYFCIKTYETATIANCELKVSPLNKIKISSTPPTYKTHNGTNFELNSLLNTHSSKNWFFIIHYQFIISEHVCWGWSTVWSVTDLAVGDPACRYPPWTQRGRLLVVYFVKMTKSVEFQALKGSISDNIYANNLVCLPESCHREFPIGF